MTKKEQKAKEDAEFEAMMAGLDGEKKAADNKEENKTAPAEAGDNAAKNAKKKAKAKAK